MLSLWLDTDIIYCDIEFIQLYQLKKLKRYLISPSLHTSISPLIKLLSQQNIAFEVMMPIPLEWAKSYLKQHDRLLYDELLWLVEHAQRIHEPLPFSWVTPISYFESETDFSFQRYMAAKEMSYIDDGMCVIAHAKAFASTAPSSVGDIYRMRIREHASKPLYKVEVSDKDKDSRKGIG